MREGFSEDHNRAVLAFGEGRLDDALAMWNAMPELDPTSPFYDPGMNRSIAGVHLRKCEFGRARDLIEVIISATEDEHNKRYSSDFATLGVCFWMGRDYEHALASWKRGLRSNYADSANVQIPLLIWFGNSWLRSDTSEIIGLLRRRVGDRRTGIGWPLPIAQYLLGRKSLEQLRAEAEMSSHAHIQIRQRRQAEFYVAVQQYMQGETELFAATMSEIAGTKELLSESERYLAQSLVRDTPTGTTG